MSKFPFKIIPDKYSNNQENNMNISLTEDSIKIIDATHLTENHRVVVNIDLSSLPISKRQEVFNASQQTIIDFFKPAKVLVSPFPININTFEVESE
jgi:hypothetical protein